MRKYCVKGCIASVKVLQVFVIALGGFRITVNTFGKFATSTICIWFIHVALLTPLPLLPRAQALLMIGSGAFTSLQGNKAPN